MPILIRGLAVSITIATLAGIPASSPAAGESPNKKPDGFLAIESSRPGTHLEVHSGSEPTGDNLLRTLALPHPEPISLPPGVYSLTASLDGHITRRLTGDDSVAIRSGETLTVALWMQPVREVLIVPISASIRDVWLYDMDEDGLDDVVVQSGAEDHWAFSYSGSLGRIDPPPEHPDGTRRTAWTTSRQDEKHEVPSGSKFVRVNCFVSAPLLDGGETADVLGTQGGWILIRDRKGHDILEMDAGSTVHHIATGDLDGNGWPEILAGTRHGTLVSFDRKGNPLFSRQMPARIYDLTTGDLDADGRSEIIASTSENRLFVLTVPPSPDWYLPLRSDSLTTRSTDLDVDDHQEILAWDGDGNLVAASPDFRDVLVANGEKEIEAIHDMDGDGLSEVLLGGFDGHITVLSKDRQPKRFDTGAPLSEILVADLDGDKSPEIICRQWNGHYTSEDRRSFRSSSGGFSSDSDESQILIVLDSGFEKRWTRTIPDAYRRFSVCDYDGKPGAEILIGTATGKVLILDAEGQTVREEELDGGISRLLVCRLARGKTDQQLVVGTPRGAINILDLPSLELRSSTAVGGSFWADRARFSSFTGPFEKLAIGDLDGDGLQEILAGVAGPGLERRLVCVDHTGKRRFDVEAPFAISHLATADMDRDGAEEIVMKGTEVDSFVLDGAGRVLFRRPSPLAAGFAAVDFSPRTLPMLVTRLPNVGLTGFQLTRDPRTRLRQLFLDAIAAAREGDEENAARLFDRSRLRWLPFDDSDLPGIRAQLRTLTGSESAQRMANILDSVRPPTTNREWVQGAKRLLAADLDAATLKYLLDHVKSFEGRIPFSISSEIPRLAALIASKMGKGRQQKRVEELLDLVLEKCPTMNEETRRRLENAREAIQKRREF